MSLNLKISEKNPVEFTCDICMIEKKRGVVVGNLPPPHDRFQDGHFTDDNCFCNLPKELGYYRCKVRFVFYQDYSEGYPSDGGWELVIKEAIKLAGPQIS